MLSKEDIKILKYLKKRPGSSIKDLEKSFRKIEHMQTRVYRLGLQYLVAEHVKPNPAKFVGDHTGTYELTPYGLMALEAQEKTFGDKLKRCSAFWATVFLGLIAILSYIDPNAELWINAEIGLLKPF